MPNILIAHQLDPVNRMPDIAQAVELGAATVSTAVVQCRPLGSLDIATLEWCDGLALGVLPDPTRLDALEAAWHGLDPGLWDAVQGKFATVFVSCPCDVAVEAQVREQASALLTGQGMLVTGFAEEPSGRDSSPVGANGGVLRAYERLGRLLTGMVGASVDRQYNPARARVLASLVHATRRVPAVRPCTPRAGVA